MPVSNFAEYARRVAAAARRADADPTEAQREALNHKVGKVYVHGLEISITNPKGSIRRGRSAEGKAWERVMAHHYGHICRTESEDGEHFDVFIGENPESQLAFTFDFLTADHEHDETKAIIGVRNLNEAKAVIRKNYPDGWLDDRIGEIRGYFMGDFKKWLRKRGMWKKKAVEDLRKRIVIENPKGTTKDFGPDYPIPKMTYPTDYGSLPGYRGEDEDDLDFFTGTGAGHGRFRVNRPDVAGGVETKYWTGLSPEEKAAVINAFKPVVNGEPEDLDDESLLREIEKHRAKASMDESLQRDLAIAGASSLASGGVGALLGALNAPKGYRAEGAKRGLIGGVPSGAAGFMFVRGLKDVSSPKPDTPIASSALMAAGGLGLSDLLYGGGKVLPNLVLGRPSWEVRPDNLHEHLDRHRKVKEELHGLKVKAAEDGHPWGMQVDPRTGRLEGEPDDTYTGPRCPKCKSADVGYPRSHPERKNCGKCRHYWVEGESEKESKERPHTVAVDLDGTILTPATPPDFGRLRPKAKAVIQGFKDKGYRVIIFTVRGDTDAVGRKLVELGVPYDYINENPDQPKDGSGKVIADVYIDDRAVSADKSWTKIEEEVEGRREKASALISEEEVREAGKKDRTLDRVQEAADLMSGIQVWYNPGPPAKVFIDVMDWGNPKAGELIGKELAKVVGKENVEYGNENNPEGEGWVKASLELPAQT